jgi:outer membrane immunogenic protein
MGRAERMEHSQTLLSMFDNYKKKESSEMKSLVLAAAVAAISSSAFAGGPTVVADDPMPDAMAAPAAAHDWSGAYVGLSYGRTTGDITFSTAGFFDTENGTIRGLYAGYLAQRGSFVFGGELAFGSVKGAGVVGVPTSEFVKAVDLKGRAGFAMNNTLLYGALGYSKVDFDDTPAIEFDMSGLNYGIGAEVAVSQMFTVGVEYLARNVDGQSSILSTTRGDANFDTLSLRVGLSF